MIKLHFIIAGSSDRRILFHLLSLDTARTFLSFGKVILSGYKSHFREKFGSTVALMIGLSISLQRRRVKGITEWAYFCPLAPVRCIYCSLIPSDGIISECLRKVYRVASSIKDKKFVLSILLVYLYNSGVYFKREKNIFSKLK